MRGYGGLLSPSSLGFRLGTTLVLALLPLGVLSMAQTRTQLDLLQAATLAGIGGASLEAADAKIDVIRRAKATGRTLAAILSAGIPPPAQCTRMMQAAAGAVPPVTLVAYVPLSGRMTCASTGTAHDFSGHPLFAEMIARPEPSVVFNPQGPVSEAAVIGLGYPVYDLTGGQVGIVSVSLPHQSVVPQDYSDETALWQPALLATFTEDGRVLGTSGAPAALVPGLLPGLSWDTLAQRVGRPFFQTGEDGQRRVVSVNHLADRLFLLAIWQSDGSTGSAIMSPFLLPALTWAAALVAAAFASGRLVVRHVRALWRSMTSFVDGRHPAPLPAMDEAPHEIRKLHSVYRTLIETIERDEADLYNLLVDKDLLLKELHHRSGNSLQIMASVMRMYRRETQDPEVRAILDALIARIIALSSTHTSLYSLSGRRTVALNEVLAGVIDRMCDIHGVSPGLTRSRLAPIAVSAQQAVPIAMALAEALGCLYLAPDPKGQGVDLTLAGEGDDEARLSMRGPASPEFGADIVHGTAALPRRMLLQFAAQLRGRVTTRIEADRALIDLVFPLHPA